MVKIESFLLAQTVDVLLKKMHAYSRQSNTFTGVYLSFCLGCLMWERIKSIVKDAGIIHGIRYKVITLQLLLQ